MGLVAVVLKVHVCQHMTLRTESEGPSRSDRLMSRCDVSRVLHKLPSKEMLLFDHSTVTLIKTCFSVFFLLLYIFLTFSSLKNKMTDLG